MFNIIASASAFATTTPPYLVYECRGVLHHVYSDGFIVRSSKPSFNVPIRDDSSVLWKDVLFDAINNLQLRLYKPVVVASSPFSTSGSKLPIFYYIYGGGFCIRSLAWSNCQKLFPLGFGAQGRGRLSRLSPSSEDDAIEDGFMAVKWLQAQVVSEEPDTWLTDVAKTPTRRRRSRPAQLWFFRLK